MCIFMDIEKIYKNTYFMQLWELKLEKASKISKFPLATYHGHISSSH